MRYFLWLFLFCSVQLSGQTLRKPGDNHSIPVVMGTGLPDPHLDTIRARIIADLLSPVVVQEEVLRIMQSQKPDGTWSGIDYKDVSRTGFQHSQHLQNMIVLARAYKKNASPLYRDPAVKNAVSRALDYWQANDFICENWWWNEMGTPHQMINLLLLLDTDLTEKQRTEGIRIAGRANLEASGARPGGDLIQIAGMLGKQALFQRNSEVLAKVIQILASEMKVSGGRGLKPDLSFHHRTDNVISTNTYGTGFAATFAYWAAKIGGTAYSLPEPATQLLVDYFLDGISQSLVYGKFPDPGASNREITRKGALGPVGASIAENLLAATNYRKAELTNLRDIQKGMVPPNRTKDFYFWHSHYYTHQRPDYHTSVRMHSNRASNMEQPHNEEGLQNHHYGDGSHFISRKGDEYNHIFPVWNWQKIPGTTVVQKPSMPHWKDLARQGRNDFTGGVTDKRYGAAAFDFESVHDPLAAKKAWFFFDKEFVCLGAGITSTSDYEVSTTLNQCVLNGDVTISRTGVTEKLASNNHQKPDQVQWVLHDSIGYIFPEATTLHLSNEKKVGSWRSITHQSWATSDTVSKDVFTLWLDHGIKPKDKTYQYMVVPGLTEAGAEQYYSHNPITILSNTPEKQAVEHKTLGVTQLVFYKAGSIQWGGLTLSVDQPCMVMVNMTGGTIKKLTVSDPTGRLKKLKLEVNRTLIGTSGQWLTSWDEGRKTSTITFTLPQEGMAGQSVLASFGN